MRSRLALAATAAVVGIAVIVVIVAVVAPREGSESSRRDLAKTQPPATTAPSAPPPPQPQGDATAGREVFAAEGCGNCHTFAAAGSTATIGPNLDELTPDFASSVEQVRKGGEGMPAFQGILTEQEIADVVAFVIDREGR